MTTLSEVINQLAAKGYDHEFQWSGGRLCAHQRCYDAQELTIIRTYRFEGMSDPADMAVLYLMRANDGLIAYCVDAYGAYSNEEAATYADFIRRIPVKDHDQQEFPEP